MIHDFSSPVPSLFLRFIELGSPDLFTLAKFFQSEYSRLVLLDSPHASFDRLLEGTSWTWTRTWNGQGAAMATGADVDDAREQARDG